MDVIIRDMDVIIREQTKQSIWNHEFCWTFRRPFSAGYLDAFRYRSFRLSNLTNKFTSPSTRKFHHVLSPESVSYFRAVGGSWHFIFPISASKVYRLKSEDHRCIGNDLIYHSGFSSFLTGMTVIVLSLSLSQWSSHWKMSCRLNHRDFDGVFRFWFDWPRSKKIENHPSTFRQVPKKAPKSDTLSDFFTL